MNSAQFTRTAPDDSAVNGELMQFKLYENVESRPLPEEKLRGKFNGYVDYLLYCCSLTGSLANLTRFPYLAYTYNGCSFLVQFLILVFLIGIPWCFMETALGQYSGRGPPAIGDMVPIGKGVAIAMGYVCLLNVVCYSPIQARCLLYMYLSLSEPQLPWTLCRSANVSECLDDNKRLSNTDKREVVSLDKNVLYDGLGRFSLPLLYCLAVSWTINCYLLVASDETMKYLRIFGSIAPFAFLFTVLGIIFSNRNAWDGFKTLFDVTTINFLDLHSWRRAAEQVLYSLDVGTGHLIIYGQNCDFRNNVLRNLLFVVFLDIVCVMASSLVIYGTVNIIARKFHISFNSVFISGPGMFFIAISRVVADLPCPKISSFAAFSVMFVICILTQLSFLKPVIYLLNVYFTGHDLENSYWCAEMLCLTMFGSSLVTVTGGGEMLISLLDDIGSAMGILVITIFEAILIFGIYGINEFCTDLTFMMDHPPSNVLKILFIAGPVFTINILLACSFYWIPPSFQNIPYPMTTYYIAWMMVIITILIITIAAVHTMVVYTREKNFWGSFEPTERWVPDLMHSLDYAAIKDMTSVREEVVHDSEKRLIFGFGKPRLSLKTDKATQTNENKYKTQLLQDYALSNQLFQHLYLEVMKKPTKEFEILRVHNEKDVIAWYDDGYTKHLLDDGILEKYVQTDYTSDESSDD